MATINYLPSFPISDRVFPCPRKHMLIYGQKSPSPPPATLTQEQLARDAGQLVQAHAALDKLVSDTDRNANSLLDRIQQVVNCTEEVNKVLDSAGLAKSAGIVGCVEALKKRCEHHQKNYQECSKKLGDLSVKMHDLKERNKRLHDAQGTGNSAAAELINVRKRLLSSFPGKTVEGAAIALGGITTEGVVEELVEALKRKQPTTVGERMMETCQRAAAALSRAGIPGDTLDVDKGVEHLIAENKRLCGANIELLYQRSNLVEENNRLKRESGVGETHQALHDAGVEPRLGNLIERVRSLVEERDRLRGEAGKDPALDKLVQEAHRLLHKAEVSPLSGTLVERVEALIEDRDRLQRLVSAGDLLLHKAVNDAHLLLDKAGIPGGTLDERVRVAIERGQRPAKPCYFVRVATDHPHMWEVVKAGNSTVVAGTCRARSSADLLCSALNAELEAR